MPMLFINLWVFREGFQRTSQSAGNTSSVLCVWHNWQLGNLGFISSSAPALRHQVKDEGKPRFAIHGNLASFNLCVSWLGFFCVFVSAEGRTLLLGSLQFIAKSFDLSRTKRIQWNRQQVFNNVFIVTFLNNSFPWMSTGNWVQYYRIAAFFF